VPASLESRGHAWVALAVVAKLSIAPIADRGGRNGGEEELFG
jgi:hypothetical protein